MHNTLAIDPSINDIGCCIVDSKGKYLGGDTIKTRGKSATEKIKSLTTAFSQWIETHRGEFSEIVIEHTRFFARANHRSHSSAQKLNLAKGVLYGIASHACPNLPVNLVWIPGFNKTQAQLLAKGSQCPDTMTQHEIDAFWLANHWALAPKAQKQIYLEAPLES